MLRINDMVKGGHETKDLIRHRSRREDCTHELAMNITTDGDWAPDWLYVGFFHQDLPRLRVSVSVDRGVMASLRTLSQSFFTSASVSCLHWLSCSIQPSISCSMIECGSSLSCKSFANKPKSRVTLRIRSRHSDNPCHARVDWNCHGATRGCLCNRRSMSMSSTLKKTHFW